MIEVKLFVFILSILFIIKNAVVLGMKLFQQEPQPMTLTRVETILMYLSISYFITYIFI
jgi:hypothetical protein